MSLPRTHAVRHAQRARVTDKRMFAMPWCLSHKDWQSFGFTFSVFFLHLIKKVLHFNWKPCNLMLETYGLSNSLPHLMFKMCAPPLFPSFSLKSSCELHPRCNKREMNLTAVLNDIRCCRRQSFHTHDVEVQIVFCFREVRPCLLVLRSYELMCLRSLLRIWGHFVSSHN